MNKEQIIDEVYENYIQTKIIKTDSGETHISPPGHYNGMTKEEFINKCKTDPEFSEKCGLKIEERELSYSERRKYRANTIGTNYNQTEDDFYDLDKYNIPTKLITLTYNNEKIKNEQSR